MKREDIYFNIWKPVLLWNPFVTTFVIWITCGFGAVLYIFVLLLLLSYVPDYVQHNESVNTLTRNIKYSISTIFDDSRGLKDRIEAAEFFIYHFDRVGPEYLQTIGFDPHTVSSIKQKYLELLKEMYFREEVPWKILS